MARKAGTAARLLAMALLVPAACTARPSQTTESAVRELVRQLDRDRIDERGEAIGALMALGARALPFLEAVAAASEDPLLLGQIDYIVAEVGRRARVESLWPPERRVSVHVQSVPLRRAFEEALGPFGLDSLWSRTEPSGDALGGEEGSRRISLRLANATFWEALDGFTAAAGWEQCPEDKYAETLTVGPSRHPARAVSWADAGPARVYGRAYRQSKWTKLSFAWSLPPAYRAMSVDVEAVASGEATWTECFIRDRDVPTRSRTHLWAVRSQWFHMPDEFRGDTVRVEGHLAIQVAREVVRHEFVVEPGSRRIPTPTSDRAVFLCSVETPGRAPQDLEQVTGHAEALDVFCRPSSDRGARDLHVKAWCGSVASQGGSWLLPAGSRLVFLEVTRSEVLRQPFTLDLRVADR